MGSQKMNSADEVQPARYAIVTDLDGTLLMGDTFIESVAKLALMRPWTILPMVGRLMMGRPVLKAWVAANSPYRADRAALCGQVVDILEEGRANQHAVVLATAAHRSTADAVARELGIFDAVLATDERRNLKGHRKAECLREWCTKANVSGFTYIGDSHADLPIWADADTAVVVKPSRHLEKRVRGLGKPTTVVGRRPSSVRLAMKALRPHQWAKNLLVFAPMVLAQKVDLNTFWKTSVAFVAFSACASGVYLLNDILDATSDRKHPRKARRPVASGDLSVPTALAIAGGLLAIGLGSAATLSATALLLMMGYLGANHLYSTWLKSKPLIDVIMLSGMYGVRLEMGAVSAGVPLSQWLLAFSLFLFTSLAFAKRYVELRGLQATGGAKAAGRGYQAEDADLIESLGPASGYVAVLVLALYANSDQMKAIYGDGRLLWLLCPLLMYWITRVWLLAKRGVLDDDPVVFALRDRVSVLVALLAAGIVAAATWATRSG